MNQYLLTVPPEGLRYDGKPIRPVTAWSYSALAQFEECPLRHYGVKVLGYPDPPSKALKEGRKVHEEGDEFLKQPRAPLPKRYAKFDKLMHQLRDLGAYPALKIVYKQDWTESREGWFGKDVWLRLEWDSGVVYGDGHVDIIDFKTGRRYASNDEQLELYALTAMLKFRAKTVSTRLWYLDSGLEIPAHFDASQAGAIMSKWTARANRMLSTTEFHPKPSDKCGFCPLSSKHKGGPCRAG